MRNTIITCTVVNRLLWFQSILRMSSVGTVIECHQTHLPKYRHILLIPHWGGLAIGDRFWINNSLSAFTWVCPMSSNHWPCCTLCSIFLKSYKTVDNCCINLAMQRAHVLTNILCITGLGWLASRYFCIICSLTLQWRPRLPTPWPPWGPSIPRHLSFFFKNWMCIKWMEIILKQCTIYMYNIYFPFKMLNFWLN